MLNLPISIYSGISLETKFKVICDSWSDEDLQLRRSPSDDAYFVRPMTYKFFYEDRQGWSLLHSSDNPISPLMHLPVNPKLPLKVEISDIIGSPRVVNLAAHVQPFTANYDDMLKMLVEIEGEMNQLILNKVYKGALRLQSSIIAYLDRKSSCSSDNEFTKKQHQNFRSALISSVSLTYSFLETEVDIRQGSSIFSRILGSNEIYYLHNARLTA